MSDFFKIKIISTNKALYAPDEYIEEEYGIDLLNEVLEEIDVEKEVESFRDFKKIFFDTITKETYADIIAKLDDSFYYNSKIIKQFHENFPPLSSDEMYDISRYWLLHNLIAEAFPDNLESIPAQRVQIQAAQFSTDGHLPIDLSDISIFCMRVLTEGFCDGDSLEASPIYKYYQQFGDDTWAQYDFNGHDDDWIGIVWGSQLIESIPIEIHNEEFWKEHKNQWWTQDDSFKELNGATCHVNTYDVYIHNHWIPILTHDSFYSKA
ncbi:MAG: hypothetical protein GY754_04365 [bacterium]|nr:hypothetical protein [bacterium]